MSAKTTLITGASAGIGAELARFLALKGQRVIITARRQSVLSELAEKIASTGAQVQVIAADLAHERQRVRLYEQVSQAGALDVLINNAGFGWYGYYADMPRQTARQMMAVNMEAVAHLTSLFLPDMLARRSGHIINIGSVAGAFPNQGVALYSASKAFLDAFTTALHRELRGSGVYASVMRLGPIRTEFFERARQLENGGSIPAEKLGVGVQHVSRALWRLLQRPRRVLYLPAWLWVSQFADPLFGSLVDRLGPLLLRRTPRKSA